MTRAATVETNGPEQVLAPDSEIWEGSGTGAGTTGPVSSGLMPVPPSPLPGPGGSGGGNGPAGPGAAVPGGDDRGSEVATPAPVGMVGASAAGTTITVDVVVVTWSLTASVAGSSSASVAPSPATRVAVPTAVEIPAIGVDARIVPVRLRANGDLETPDFGLAGWYALGPRPGDVGPAVIAAHVDSRSGPDVFARLSELQTGQRIVVHRADGTTQAFVVEHSEQAPKDELPVKRIWGRTAGPTLRLVTCGGTFDASSGHYRDNVIVYARAL